MALGDKLKQKIAGVGETPPENTNRAPTAKPTSQPRTAPGTMLALMEKEEIIASLVASGQANAEEIEALRAELKEAYAKPLEATIADLVEVPGRRRALTDEQFEELRENLRTNPLIHPITVRPLEDGRAEVISGHNRIEAYRQLGRDTIPAFALHVPENVAAEVAAFHANLIQPELSEFEKYEGFKKIHLLSGKQLSDIQRASGMSTSSFYRIMSFDNMPDEVLRIVQTNKSAFKGRALDDLSALAKSGQTDEAIAKAKQIAESKSSKPKKSNDSKGPSKAASGVINTSIKVGSDVYAKVRSTETTLKITFQMNGERELVEKAIRTILEKRSDELRQNQPEK